MPDRRSILYLLSRVSSPFWERSLYRKEEKKRTKEQKEKKENNLKKRNPWIPLS